MRRRALALLLLLVPLLFLGPPVQGATQEIVTVDGWDFSNALAETGASGRLLSDNHPSDSGSTSSLGQTFRPTQDIPQITTATFSLNRGGVGGNPTATLTAVVSDSDGQVPTTELFRSPTIVDSSTVSTSTFTINRVSFQFTSGHPTLKRDTWYSVEIQTSATGTIDLGNSISVHLADETRVNHQGRAFFYSSAGYAAINEATDDFVFEIKGAIFSGGGSAGAGDGQPPAPAPTGPLAGGSLVLALVAVGIVYWFGVKGKRR